MLREGSGGGGGAGGRCASMWKKLIRHMQTGSSAITPQIDDTVWKQLTTETTRQPTKQASKQASKPAAKRTAYRFLTTACARVPDNRRYWSGQVAQITRRGGHGPLLGFASRPPSPRPHASPRDSRAATLTRPLSAAFRTFQTTVDVRPALTPSTGLRHPSFNHCRI